LTAEGEGLRKSSVFAHRVSGRRLSLLWLAALVAWAGFVASPRMTKLPTRPVAGPHDLYWVDARMHLVLQFGAVFAGFSLLYLAFERLFRRRPSCVLAGLHLLLFLAGVTAISAPEVALAVRRPAVGELIEALAVWSRVSSFGYLLVLGSLCALAAALVEAGRPRAGAAKPG
jgi:hypothetical protein